MTMLLLLSVLGSTPPQLQNPDQILMREYPGDALFEAAEGVVRVSLRIGKNGRAKGCKVVQSSGYRSLDLATCRNLQGRARFTPATDDAGNVVEGSYKYEMTWRLSR